MGDFATASPSHELVGPAIAVSTTGPPVEQHCRVDSRALTSTFAARSRPADLNIYQP